jgi:hypothetical protein
MKTLGYGGTRMEQRTYPSTVIYKKLGTKLALIMQLMVVATQVVSCKSFHVLIT